jgi:Spy/CpxP family protein refolding chaperone
VPSLAKRTAAFAAVLATTAIAAAVPATTAAADPPSPSYQDQCPSWYGYLNPMNGCMPYALINYYTWLRAQDGAAPPLT